MGKVNRCMFDTVFYIRPQNQAMNSRVKHIDIKYHSIRQTVFDKRIELVKIDDKIVPTDALIKVITLEIFRRHCATMQVLHGKHG